MWWSSDGTPLPDGEFELALDAPGALSVYRNMQAMPRAWVVHEATTADDMDAAVEAIQSPEFDPDAEAVVVGDTLPAVGPRQRERGCGYGYGLREPTAWRWTCRQTGTGCWC